MERLEKLLATTIPEVVRSSATREEVERWLGEPTTARCGTCGKQNLTRFESLNGRCESCRIAYLDVVDADEGRKRDRDCSSCHGTGWKVADDDRRVTRCECRPVSESERITRLLSRAGVPPEYVRCSWATWQGAVPVAAKRYGSSDEISGVLFVHGLQGRGKTHLATAVFREVALRGMTCLWRDCNYLVDECRRMLSRGLDDALEAEIFRLRQADLLLLDDFGSGRQTEYAEDVVDGLIRWRHREQLPIIVTSNRDLRAIVAPTTDGGLGRDPAIASRLRGVEIEVTGHDRRSVLDR